MMTRSNRSSRTAAGGSRAGRRGLSLLVLAALAILCHEPASARRYEFSAFSTIGFEGRMDGEFFLPEGLILGPAGELVIADHRNHRVQVLTPDGKFQRSIYAATYTLEIAAQMVATRPDDRPRRQGEKASATRDLRLPVGLALHDDGRLFVSSFGSHQIHVYEFASGKLVNVLGRYGRGPGQFVNPQGIDILRRAPDPILAVADQGNRRVQLLKLDGSFIHEIHYQEELPKGGLRSLQPKDVKFLRSGDLVVSYPTFHQVVCWSLDGQVRWRYGSLGRGKGELNTPSFLAETDDDRILVADSRNHRIVMLDKDGMYAQHFSAGGTTPGRVQRPQGIALTSQGHLVVVDSGNSRIQIFQPSQISQMMRLAEEHAEARRWDEAMSQIEKVLHLEPANNSAITLYVRGLFFQGDQCFQQQAFDRADEIYRRILIYRPDSSEVRDRLSAVFWAKHRDLIVRVISGIIAAVSAMILLALLKNLLWRTVFATAE